MSHRAVERRRSHAADSRDLWPILDPRMLTRLRRALRRWYASSARDLPWRRTRDPYAIWISEIMLQQTTVKAVVPFFERFLRRFPSVQALAASPEGEVLRLWEGLGYYSRARNIHRTARRVVSEFGGRFPREVEVLMTLPGIGRYTAGAIVSFAYDLPAPIVEANTLRLYCRLMGFDGDPRSSDGQRRLWSLAEQLVPRRFPGQFNQALMELGGTVCGPTDPECRDCPLQSMCIACQQGRQQEIPRPARRVEITDVTEVAVAVRKQGTYLLRLRGKGERWEGLWDFPRFELPPIAGRSGDVTRRSLIVRAEVHRLTGVEIDDPQHVTTIRHNVTRFRIELLCLRAAYREGRLAGRPQPLKWVRPRDFDAYPLSTTARKFARLLGS